MSSFFTRRARPDPPPAADPEATPEALEVVEEVRHPTAMQRERRALTRRREIEIRDVGGLAVEMVRRDRFRQELLVDRASDVLRLEQRMHELDSLLAVEVAVRGLRDVPYCKCGAPLPPGVHFCSHCGRPALSAPPVLTCAHCGQPLPAATNFCSFCGHSVAAEEYLEGSGAADAPDATMVRPIPRDSEGDRAEGA